MTKIFTIGFSGKRPEAFLDVLNAARISCVWDIRQWWLSTYVPYYTGDILASYKDKKITWSEYEKNVSRIVAKTRPFT